MSQAKVDYRKEQKRNIKKTVRTRKITTVMRTTVVAIVLVAAVAWLGYPGVSKYMDYQKENAKTVTTPVDLTAISDYLTTVNGE